MRLGMLLKEQTMTLSLFAPSRNKPLRILPNRVASEGPRTGSQLDQLSRTVADRCYFAFKAVAQVPYTKIDARYPDRDKDPNQRRLHAMKFNDAKAILNENRNQVIECVLPLYTVNQRASDVPHDETGDNEADTYAHDLIIKNVLYVMTRTLVAWTSEFVEKDEVEATKQVILDVAEVQSEKLIRELRNYTFLFKRVIAPT